MEIHVPFGVWDKLGGLDHGVRLHYIQPEHCTLPCVHPLETRGQNAHVTVPKGNVRFTTPYGVAQAEERHKCCVTWAGSPCKHVSEVIVILRSDVRCSSCAMRCLKNSVSLTSTVRG